MPVVIGRVVRLLDIFCEVVCDSSRKRKRIVVVVVVNKALFMEQSFFDCFYYFEKGILERSIDVPKCELD